MLHILTCHVSIFDIFIDVEILFQYFLRITKRMKL